MSVDGSIEAELKYRLGEGVRIMEGLASLWRTKRITIDVTIWKLERIVVPKVLYESKSKMLKCKREKYCGDD